MTAATSGPSDPIFSMFSGRDDRYRTGHETFLCSLVGQAVVLGLLIYFTSCLVVNPPPTAARFPKIDELPLIFSGRNGGGGGGLDKLPASRGVLPKASLQDQLAPPTVILPKEMPKLPVEETIVAVPDLKLQEGQIGDPLSRFTRTLSNGPGGPGGIGNGCCDGVGDSTGPHAGSGPPGIYPAGKMGVTVPQAIYSPEPSFSDEARKSRQQGVVQLLVVVGQDGRTYDIRVSQSLGMGLDEKAIEAVSRWRFKPATLNGQPVATRIAVEVDFHLY